VFLGFSISGWCFSFRRTLAIYEAELSRETFFLGAPISFSLIKVSYFIKLEHEMENFYRVGESPWQANE
jgi:hypothetical protein